jgi:hypothetical protein
MGRIARRFDRNPAEVESRWQLSLCREFVERSHHETAEVGEDVRHVRA